MSAEENKDMPEDPPDISETYPELWVITSDGEKVTLPTRLARKSALIA